MTDPPDFRAPIDPGSTITAEQAEATLVRLLTKAAAKGYEAGLTRGRDDERTRCARILQDECDKLVTAGMLRALAAIPAGKAAP